MVTREHWYRSVPFAVVLIFVGVRGAVRAANSLDSVGHHEVRRYRPVEKMVSDYQCGDSLDLIVQRYNVPYTTVRNLLANAGVKFRGQGRGNASSDTHEPTSVRLYTTDMKDP